MNTFKKITIAAVALGLVGSGLLVSKTVFADKQQSSELKTKGTLTVGLEGTYSPFSYVGKNGKLTGYDVDVATQVAKKLHLKVKFVETKFDSLPAGLDANKFDVIYNDMGINPQRQKNYSFGSQYLYTKGVLIVKKGSTLKDPAKVKGEKLAQSTSSNYGVTAQKLGADIIASPGFTESLDLVESGKAAGTFNSADSWGVYKKANPKTDLVAIDASKVLPKSGAAPMLRKDNSALAKKITKAQKALQKDGTLKKLSIKYFGSDLSKEK
ncbi:cystine transport system substrate-binding protein [Weissella oryzae SG25]|uniref:Cystine transport system substrate-binding protein n=1 Tax=Weissella oryzae (strain DSM 25784 / JCM 18191 / LMG 30913 / SG25) TaxID=1329250 RepID=A0A069CRS8_WEIOS|nr:transporter substrate-binding domain-containing protein [Weissella oryzae]GAK30109.1 cystine transport system substrate-binding protein [Weissella oryzae SG25]